MKCKIGFVFVAILAVLTLGCVIYDKNSHLLSSDFQHYWQFDVPAGQFNLGSLSLKYSYHHNSEYSYDYYPAVKNIQTKVFER